MGLFGAKQAEDQTEAPVPLEAEPAAEAVDTAHAEELPQESLPPEAEAAEAKTTEAVTAETVTPPLSFPRWLHATIFSFLDIADLSDWHARHAAICAKTLTSKQLSDIFSLAESYFVIQTAYCVAAKEDDGLKNIEAYRQKAALLKREIGL